MSSTERQLLSAWQGGHFGQFPLLKSIAISAPTGKGLRGIKNLVAEFAYPVTFFSGQNGCGKSTLLSLAALAYHGAAGHIPSSARRLSGAGANKFGYYTFQDFFYRGPGDADVSGVQIEWSFSRGTSVSITKQSDKWMRYERRPSRPVEHMGLSRAVPAIELYALRNHFGAGATPHTMALGGEALRHLATVLGRQYPSAEVLNKKRYAIRRSGRDDGYTSFNMGTGEDSLISLLARLESVPAGSLVVIEELETGLHPAAQKRAASALIDMALGRQLQIIGSTHSHHVLDSLPRQARALVIRDSDSHRIVASPSTRFALSEMAETYECELLVLCEDEFAVALIRQALPKSMRRRVDIRSGGAKSELAIQARAHLRLSQLARCLVIWDGDVTTSEADAYFRQAQSRIPGESIDSRLSWSRLPGGVCPELWALNVARSQGLEEARRIFRLDTAEETSEVLSRCGLADPHSILFELSRLTGLPEDTAQVCLLDCVTQVSPDINTLVQAISTAIA